MVSISTNSCFSKLDKEPNKIFACDYYLKEIGEKLINFLSKIIIIIISTIILTTRNKIGEKYFDLFLHSKTLNRVNNEHWTGQCPTRTYVENTQQLQCIITSGCLCLPRSLLSGMRLSRIKNLLYKMFAYAFRWAMLPMFSHIQNVEININYI